MTVTFQPPPQAIAAERAVLAAMMLGAAARGANALARDAFFRIPHQRIFDALVTLEKAGQATDLITTCDQLRKRGQLEAVGGEDYVAGLFEEATTAANLEAHAKIVSEKALLRTVLASATELQNQCYANGDLSGSIDAIVRSVNGSHDHDEFEDVGDNLDELFVSPKPGVPLGLPCLDRLAVRRGNLCVFAARPGCGKTAMLGTISMAAARARWRVIFFSLEMSALELRQRLASDLSDIPLSRIQDPQNAELVQHIEPLKALPITLCDGRRARKQSTMTLERIIATTRNVIDRKRPQNAVVIVDYLQLVQSSAKYERRYELLGHVCRELKAMALREDVPVIVAAQLGRGVEQRGKDAKPALSDLRESGEIENTADQVILMHREPAKTLLAVAKYRMGPTFFTEARFDGEHTRFRDFGDWT